MSEQADTFLVGDAVAQMGALLGFLAPDQDDQAAAPDQPEAGAPAAGGGQPPAPAEGAGAAPAAGGAPAAGDGGQPAVPGAGAPADGSAPGAPAGGAADASGSAAPTGVDPAEILPKFGEIAVAFETRQQEQLQQSALEELQTEFPRHFQALRQPPRTLVGMEVPSTTGPGMEKLRDSTDAADWQAAMKSLLLDELASRVETKKTDMRDVFSTVHSSIELFQKNTDLIPGTRGFDKELADAFAEAMSDFELKSNGKLIGYSVPAQPVISALRKQLTARRAAAPPAAPVTPATTGTPASAPAAQPRDPATGQYTGPQAGIPSQAGSAGDTNDDAAGVMAAFFRQNHQAL